MSTLKVGGIRGVSASSDAITVGNDGTCTANITNKPNRNLVINGAMQVAQRGTSSSASGMKTVDRFNCSSSGTDETPEQEQGAVASGTTPYELGFKKSYKITNGNQTSGAGASDAVLIEYKSESQDIATSGWNFKSATSFLTMSFWVKSSVAQEFQCQLYNSDTNKAYLFTYTVSSADTWQKITHSVKGDSTVNFNFDNGAGLECAWYLFIGTDQTVANPTEDTWATYSGTSTKKNAVTTWYTTNNATFELTGVQWEVGSVATDFEHRTYAQELERCKRYFFMIGKDSKRNNVRMSFPFINEAPSNTGGYIDFRFHPEMRATPTATIGSSLQLGRPQVDMSSHTVSSFNNMGASGCHFFQYNNQTGSTADADKYLRAGFDDNSFAEFSAEL